MPKDFSYLLKPEIYHPLSPLTIPAPFRQPTRQPAPETPIPALLQSGHFRAAAISAVQALTSPGLSPTDHARIFELLYARLACLCLMDAMPLAAQEVKALEDLSSGFYVDGVTGAHLVPWALRILGVRLQAIGFGDPRRAVMSYYELAREARAEVARAVRTRDHSAAEVWKARLADLGVRVAGALVEMDDLAGAAEHLATLDPRSEGQDGKGDGRLAMSRALMWLHLGDVEAAKRCIRDGRADETGQKVVDALADMADGEYEAALQKWKALRTEMEESGVRDEMVGVNLAVCLLYVGRMEEGREVLEGLVEDGHASHTLLFNLTTIYELATDRAKSLKVRLAERVAALEPSSQGWEKTNVDFKL
ncbi:putative tetratricopeptide repeat protein 15 protein [Eutypa lata UCREL1]|uniref:Putative tetratricopeptide repeat protein 15 protein n=1 Tax=Eutypa lata (strain UCR-EL1) TaxID=1287681 RepID=M7T4P7_EUTLA|nr:putative tetratricopeptide repeat protein 15 protein [Eutypa lata UCREL1]